ncbi:hypothetical protein ODQ87_27030, partial [Escherichia coli]|nr:hypothetical protein [Escherichia coli]
IIQKYLKKKWCILSASAGRKYFIDVSVLNGFCYLEICHPVHRILYSAFSAGTVVFFILFFFRRGDS